MKAKTKAESKDESLGDVATSEESITPSYWIGGVLYHGTDSRAFVALKKLLSETAKDNTLYRLYDTVPHTIYKENITLEEIREWYRTAFNPGHPIEIEFEARDLDSYMIKDTHSGEKIGIVSTMDVLLESGFKTPDDTEFIHNPNYVPPVVKNIKGKLPRGMN